MKRVMARVLILTFLGVLLLACKSHDEQYFLAHPQSLAKAINNCSTSGDSTLSCDQLQAIAVKVNQMAFELQQSPQGFGRKIITLQEELAKAQQQIRQSSDNTELNQSIKNIRQELLLRLAMVKWLESPE